MFYNFHFILLLLTSCTVAQQLPHQSERNGRELILCRKCGGDVADAHYIFSKASPGARKTEKQNLFGKQNVTVQTLVNPFGVEFNVVTAEKANCENIGPQQGADSWFPGFTWRICACPHCSYHLGWTFEVSTSMEKNNKSKDYIQSFHGLILSNILGENFTDSLIMMPQMYKM